MLPLILAALCLPRVALAGPDAGPPDIAADTGTPAVCGDSKCEVGKEYCDTCPKDCGQCTGCQPRSKPKCPSCQCEACVCKLDSYCCSKQWDTVCASQCKDKCTGCKLIDGSIQLDGLVDAAPETAPPPACGNGKCNPANESCDTCPQDCGKCNGCKAQQGPGCPMCACEKCVCKLDSYCCSVQWDVTCANLCKTCGACGISDMGPLEAGGPDVPTLVTCGDGKCDPFFEHCDSCSKDCGQCDGCSMRLGKKCPGCKCETCVCDKDSYCCDSQWDSFCALSCKTRCTGCGAGDGGYDMPAPADISPDQPPKATCGDGLCDTLTEYCDTCPKDCGQCNGCQARSKAGCPGCACEACVCKMDPDCCKFQWDHICVSECKKNCNGCTTDAGVDFSVVDLKPADAPKKDSTTPDVAADSKPLDSKPLDSKPLDIGDSKPGDSKTDLPDNPPDIPQPPEQAADRPGIPLDHQPPSDVYFADKPAGNKKHGPGNPGSWECGCATTTPDASGVVLLVLPLLWVVSRRRRK